ncbi:MAG TPA: hypothetical protein VK631_29390 [Solirubrobacteraceae bacterium]|nr:hypothetical protein [Solirubrobacteraceae bacterium]
MRAPTLAAALAALVVAAAGCGGGDGGGGPAKDPVTQVPSNLQDKVRAARDPQASEFPKPAGKTLQALADEIGGGPQMGLAGSIYLAGQKNRLAFGVIDDQAGFVYGKTAVYYARSPESPAKGPFVAPADVLVTEPPYRSQQAATEADPFAAVYAAQVPFSKPGKYSVMSVTIVDGKPVAAPAQLTVIVPADDKIPEVGEPAPKAVTDTVASAGGDAEAIDTRRPTSDMHANFADVVGKKPVALLFATPQLCQSRVCGPVVDVGLELRSRYGDQVEFIHQEVYTDNDPNKGLRKPLQEFGLPTEPWLFVVGKDGTITARLEGSFGLGAFEQALKTAL